MWCVGSEMRSRGISRKVAGEEQTRGGRLEAHIGRSTSVGSPVLCCAPFLLSFVPLRFLLVSPDPSHQCCLCLPLHHCLQSIRPALHIKVSSVSRGSGNSTALACQLLQSASLSGHLKRQAETARWCVRGERVNEKEKEEQAKTSYPRAGRRHPTYSTVDTRPGVHV